MAPKDFKELEDMMEFAVNLKSPVVIRYPRGGEAKEKFKTHTEIQYKKGDTLTLGRDVTILAIGNQVSKAMNIFRKLKKDNINAEVINVRFLKPFDKYAILRSIAKTKFVVTIEDNTVIGGLGTEIKSIVAEKRLQDIIVSSYGYPDVFVEHGSVDELEKLYRMDENTIYNNIKDTIKYKKEKKTSQNLSNLEKFNNKKNNNNIKLNKKQENNNKK